MDILTVPLREREKQEQSGELAEGDDEWFRPTGSGRETLRQRLAQAVTVDTSIDTTSGTEHTKWVGTEPFSGGIASFASNKEEGIRKVKRYTDKPN